MENRGRDTSGLFDLKRYGASVVECVVPAEDGYLLVWLDLKALVDDTFGDLFDWLGFG